MRRFYYPHDELTNWAPSLPPVGIASKDQSDEAGPSSVTAQLDPSCALITLGEAESKHIHKVLRLKAGAAVEIFDGKGHLAQATIASSQPKRVTLTLHSISTAIPLRPRLTIASALPKAARASEMIEQLVQLGADVFIPLITTRSVAEARDNKLSKLTRTAIEASKQSERLFLLAIHEPMPFKDCIHTYQTEHLFLAHPQMRLPNGQFDTPFTNLTTTDRRDIVVCIGPEGGWTDEEVTLAVSADTRLLELGPHIMRIETAAVAAASLFKYHLHLNQHHNR